MKPTVVLISSDDDDEENSDDEEELESELDDDGDYSESDDREYDNDDEENDVESDEEEDIDHCDDRVVRPNQGSNDLPELSLNECKVYLRKHGLRLSGTKEECLQRIKEHERLKDGRGESLYPRSSFSINCTGDVCKGDVVLFRQKVYKKRGNIIGKRSVAGRIVKESYGASKQQHTFTVEVLWCKPYNNLSTLSSLLVKGRNLYKFGTFRQPWKNEAERAKVLGEKHTRGDAARHKRKIRNTEITHNNHKGIKRQKLSDGRPSQSKQQTQTDKQKSTKKRDTAPVKKPVSFQNTEMRRSIQPPFNPYQNRPVYSNHHAQQASSSASFPYGTTSLPNLPSFGFPGNHHFYNTNQQTQPNHILYQPPGYHHYNYAPPLPRYRFG